MGAARSGKHLRQWVFPAIMLGLGTIAAAIMASLPQARLDLLAWRLWLPSILPAATPPLGVTARIVLGMTTWALFAGVGMMPLLLRRRTVRLALTGPTTQDAVLPWLVDAPAQAASDSLAADHGPIATRDSQVRDTEVRAGEVADEPVLSLLARLTRRLGRETPGADAQAVRRADSHPDALPRRPIMASEDLGPPLPIVTVSASRPLPEPERPLPADLDVSLAEFDPCSVPDVPREPVRAVAPLATPPAPERAPARPATIDPGERFETFAIPAPVAAVKPASADPAVSSSDAPARRARTDALASRRAGRSEPLAALLERLERGANRRSTPEPAASLDETLVQLRRLATG